MAALKRANRTLQDRLVKKLRLAGVLLMKAYYERKRAERVAANAPGEV